MKKLELINLWKSKYNLDSKTINQVLEFVLNMDKKEVFFLDDICNEDFLSAESIFKKLKFWYPLAYITNRVNFSWLDFYVDERVLIPRDDTEVIVSSVLKHIENSHPELVSGSLIQGVQINWKTKTPYPPLSRGQEIQRISHIGQIIIDIWTWSGIIPISIVKNRDYEFEKVFALEVSKEAIKVAEKNINLHNLEDKITLINTDFRQFDFRQFSWKDLIITANLPYIKQDDFINMDKSVYTHEPELALYGWEKTWFELYEELIELLLTQRNNLNNIVLFIEIWFDQYELSREFLTSKWLKFEYFKDTNNIYRVIEVKL